MKLAEHVDKLRDLIEAAFDKQFARLGIGKNKQPPDEAGGCLMWWINTAG